MNTNETVANTTKVSQNASSQSGRMVRKPRVAICISHPIQHFCPQYASLAASDQWELKVFFASSLGVKKYHDHNFGKDICWAGLDLSGFDHEFISNEALPSGPELKAPGLTDRLAAFDPDVVISSGYFQAFQRKVQAWTKAQGRLLYYISDAQSTDRPRLHKFILKRIALRFRFAKVDRFLTVGNSNEIFYRDCGATLDRMTRMNFSIDVKAFSKAYECRQALREKIRKIYGFGPDDVVVCTAGKLVPWKRQRDLIEAIGKSPEGLGLKALIIGSGPDSETLAAHADRIAPGRIILAGFVDPIDLPGLYAASDIYAHLAAFEPHSLAISEAIFMGLPVTISDRCGSYGPTDDVQPGHNGIIYPMGDTNALAAALEALVVTPGLHDDFSTASRRYAVRAQALSHGAFLKNALRADGFKLPIQPTDDAAL